MKTIWADEHFIHLSVWYEPQSEIKSVYCLFLSSARDYKSSTAILVGFLWSWSTLLCSLRNWKQLSNTTTAQDIWLPYEWFTVTGDSRTVETKCYSLLLLENIRRAELPFDMSVSVAFCCCITVNTSNLFGLGVDFSVSVKASDCFFFRFSR